jgi:hypothetical protein
MSARRPAILTFSAVFLIVSVIAQVASGDNTAELYSADARFETRLSHPNIVTEVVRGFPQSI